MVVGGAVVGAAAVLFIAANFAPNFAGGALEGTLVTGASSGTSTVVNVCFFYSIDGAWTIEVVGFISGSSTVVNVCFFYSMDGAWAIEVVGFGATVMVGAGLAAG